MCSLCLYYLVLAIERVSHSAHISECESFSLAICKGVNHYGDIQCDGSGGGSGLSGEV
jgi:hypothetical protein